MVAGVSLRRYLGEKEDLLLAMNRTYWNVYRVRLYRCFRYFNGGLTMDRKKMLVTPYFWGRDFEVDPNLVFALIPLRDPFIEVVEDHIKKVVEEFGLVCRKADDTFAPRVIMENIWEQINRARFIVADLTSKNPNVFYEVGIAHTLGKDVILIAQSEQDVPFDLRHIRYIQYEYTPPGMRTFEVALRHSIEALLSSESIADPGLLEVQSVLEQGFSRWKRFRRLPVLLDTVVPYDTVRTITACGDHLDDVLDEHRLAFMLATALWYGTGLVYWAQKNRENEEAVSVLLEILQRPERRPLYRTGLVLEHLSPSLRRRIIDQAREQLADDERVALVLEKAERGETLKFWEKELPKIYSPEAAEELIYQAKTSKRMKVSNK